MHDALQVFLLFVYPNINTEDVTALYINFLTPVFSKPVFKTPFRDLLNYKKSNWLYFLDWRSFRSTQLNCLVDNTLSCLENIYLELVAQSYPMKNVFLKILQNWTTLLKRGPGTGVVLWNLRNLLFEICYFVKHLRTAASVHCQATVISISRKVCLYLTYCSFKTKEMLLIRNSKRN